MNLSTHLNTQHVEQEKITGLDCQSQQKPNQEIPGQKSTSDYYDIEKRKCINKKGDTAEQFVIFEALNRGAEVFPNASRVGAADIVLKINGELIEINVKMASWQEKYQSWKAENACKVSPPQWALMVEPRQSGWVVRWPRKKGGNRTNNLGFQCPTGLEDYWN